MSTITLACPDITRVKRALSIRLIAILIITILALSAGAILVVVSSTTRNGYQADLIPVAQNSISPIPVPTPPAADMQIVPFEKQVTGFAIAGVPSVVPVPVPTPPS